MHTLSNRTRMAPRLSAVLMVLALLAAVTPVPAVSAEDTQAYTADDIETWLEDAISGTTVSVTTPPSVTLDDVSNRMTVSGLTFTARGITVGLNYLRLTFGTDVMSPTTVEVAGELDVLGKYPRFWCTAQMECLGAEQKLHFASVSDIKVGDFTPSLDAGDLSTIRDTLNDILDASGLSVTSPGGDLTGISVVEDGGVDKLMTTWSGAGPAYLEVAELESKLGGMADTLASKAGSYLAAGEGQWNVAVVVNPDKEALEVDASLSAFGITAALSDFNVTFATLTASVDVATLSVGTATKTFTFSLEADIDCDAGVPSVTMVDLTIGDEYPGFRDFIADIQAALLAAIEDAFDAVVDDTGLTWPFCPASITVENETVVLHSAGEVAVEIPLKTGWNMVSVPLTVADPSTAILFPGSVVYTWNADTKAYYSPIAIAPEVGYWVWSSTDRLISISGSPITTWTRSILAGWNMVGSIYDQNVPFSDPNDLPDGIVLGYAYAWDPVTKSYDFLNTLVTLRGHWVAAVDACSLTAP